jgi:hypothetical protein
MPRSARADKRSDGNATKVMRIATGEEPDDQEGAPPPSAAQQLGRLGGAARAKALSAARRTEIAKKAAAVRWRK